MIRACEGTDSPDGYRALFGYTPRNGKTFDNGFIQHPNIRGAFTQTDGTLNYSTAAGAYQFIKPTWDRAARAIGAPDFSPAWQDQAALYLIDVDAHAIEDVEAGRFNDAVNKCSGIWASLPASHYLQPKRSVQFALNAYTQAGGTVA
jgi:muramidase (phage lysozyme)